MVALAVRCKMNFALDTVDSKDNVPSVFHTVCTLNSYACYGLHHICDHLADKDLRLVLRLV